MAKDSTAVRKLIELSQQKPIDVDLGGLFDGEPPRSAQRAPLPPPRASGIQPVAAPPPLPRTRTPAGTQSNPTVLSPAAADGTPAPERIETAADELFGMKALPPLPSAGPAAPPPPQTLPPRRQTITQAPPLQAQAPQPRPVAPAPRVHEPVATAPVELSEMEDNGWFQQSEAVPMVDDFLVGTQAVEKSRGSAVVAIAAAFGLGIVAAGGYLVYQRINAKDPKAVAAVSAQPAAETAAPRPQPVSPSIAAAEKAPAPAPVAADPASAQAAPAPASAEAAPAPAAAAPTVASIEAAPAPAVAAAVAPAPAAAAPVAGSMIDVILKSEPAGVTVMLIDGGGAVKLGKTPTTASLSAGTQHQILFSRDGYTATIATIDPAAQTDVMVALAPAAGGAAPAGQVALAQPAPAAPTPTVQPIETAPAPAPAKAKVQHTAAATPAPAATKAPRAHAATHADASPPVEARADHAEKSHASAAKRTATAVSSGGGTLMIGAKPPCEIIVDGRATGLTTPQRAINLPAGAHSITLVNKANNIKKSFSVAITAGSPTKVVKDFTALMNK